MRVKSSDLSAKGDQRINAGAENDLHWIIEN
jgi:hypothetical protein